MQITWTDLTHTYDSEKHEPTVSLTNLVDDDECKVTLVTADDAGIKVGKYIATVTNSTNTNYVLPNKVTQEYIINKAVLVVKINDKAQVYHAPEETLSVEIVGNIYKNDNQDGSVYTISRESGESVGKYRISGTSTNPNYSVTFISTVEDRSYGLYEITPQDVNIIWSTEYVYSGYEHTVSAQIIDVYTSETILLPVETFQDSNLVTFKNAGTYTLKAIDASSNYTLLNNNVEGEIIRVTLLIQPNDLTVRYGEDFTLTASFKGFVGDDNENSLFGGNLSTEYKLNDNITGEGNYEIIAEGYYNSNYDIEYVSGTLHVEGTPVTVLIKDQTSVYGDSILEPEYEIIDAALMNPGAIFVIEKDDGITVGEYAIRGRTLTRNYAVKFITEHEDLSDAVYKITPREITVKISDTSSVYKGVEKDLRALVEIESGTIIGEDNDDWSVYDLVREQGNTVGKYKIFGLSNNINYAVKFVSKIDKNKDYGIYRINPKPISAPIQDETYFEYNGQEHTYNINNWMYREYFTLSGDALNEFGEPKQVNAGVYNLFLEIDPNCEWVDVPLDQDFNNLVLGKLCYKFIIHKAAFDSETIDCMPYQGVYDGLDHSVIKINQVEGFEYEWWFKLEDGVEYTNEMPKLKKAGEHIVNFKVTSQNYADYVGEFVVSIAKAKIIVMVDKNATDLDSFTIIGLQGNDVANEVVKLSYADEESNGIKYHAELIGEYVDCYEIENIFETDGTTVTKDDNNNLLLIIGAIGCAVVACGGGGAITAMTIKRRRKRVI